MVEEDDMFCDVKMVKIILEFMGVMCFELWVIN